MRALRTLLLILAVLLGQSHLCAREYVSPTGQVCATCEALVAAPPVESRRSPDALESRHGDCRDCCTVKACDKAPQPIPADAKPAPTLAAILPPAFVFVPVVLADRRVELPPSVRLYLPHGPPGERSSRAPPRPFA